MRISDPAPLPPDMKPERYRGVHCIRFVSTNHIVLVSLKGKPGLAVGTLRRILHRSKGSICSGLPAPHRLSLELP
jgi:hypothetical protein